MRVVVVVIAMWVSAFRPTSQHLTEPSDDTQLHLATPAFDAGLVATPDGAAVLPAILSIGSPSRSYATITTDATDRPVADTFVSSQLARGPPV